MDPEGVPSGVSYIAETGDSVDAPELNLLMIGGGGRRVSAAGLLPLSSLLRAGKSSLKGASFSGT